MRVRLSSLPAVVLVVAVAIALAVAPPRDPAITVSLEPGWRADATVLLAAATGPLRVTGWVAFVTGADSSVKVGTGVTLAGWVAGDTLRFDFYRNDSLLITHRRNPAAAVRDSTTLVAPAYGKSAIYKGCAQGERGGRASGVRYPTTPRCWTWSYARPLPTGSIDSLWRLSALIVRPLPPDSAIAADSGSRCASWQAANVGASPWVADPDSVNLAPVPACRGADGTRTTVWQFCALGELRDSVGTIRRVKMRNSWNSAYCEREYQKWVAENSPLVPGSPLLGGAPT